jgi:hypothetical protein
MRLDLLVRWAAVLAVGLDGFCHMFGLELGVGHPALAYLQARDA